MFVPTHVFCLHHAAWKSPPAEPWSTGHFTYSPNIAQLPGARGWDSKYMHPVPLPTQAAGPYTLGSRVPTWGRRPPRWICPHWLPSSDLQASGWTRHCPLPTSLCRESVCRHRLAGSECDTKCVGSGESHRNVKPPGNEGKQQGLVETESGGNTVWEEGGWVVRTRAGVRQGGLRQGGAAGNSCVGWVPSGEMGPDLSSQRGCQASPSSTLERCHWKTGRTFQAAGDAWGSSPGQRLPGPHQPGWRQWLPGLNPSEPLLGRGLSRSDHPSPLTKMFTSPLDLKMKMNSWNNY